MLQAGEGQEQRDREECRALRKDFTLAGSPFLEPKGQAGKAGKTTRCLLASFTLGNQNLPGAGSGFLQHRPTTGLTLGQRPSLPLSTQKRGLWKAVQADLGSDPSLCFFFGCVTIGRSLGLSRFSLLISVMGDDNASFQSV